MKLIMYGVNRDTVSCDDVHKYSLNESLRTSHLTDISAFDGVEELVLVASRNRNEYYLYIDEQMFKHGDLLRYLAQHTGKPLEEIILETYSKFNNDVIKHLFNLVSVSNKTSESTSVLEQALSESNKFETSGNLLNELFRAAIRFSISLYDKKSLYPLLNGELPKAVQRLRKHYPDKEDINYLFIGHNDVISQLIKYVTGEPNSYVTLVERNARSKELISNVKNWLALTDELNWKNHITSVDLGQLVYRMAKADVVIIGPSIQHAWISHELLEDIYEMRPTAKKQLIMDLSGAQDETIFTDYQNIDYALINDSADNDYPADKLEEAKNVYEEYLTNQSNEFMAYFNQFNESIANDNSVSNQQNQKVRIIKQISCKV